MPNAANHHTPMRPIAHIEFDGPQYRDTPAARDRERLRPQQPRDRGWRYLRVWVLSWCTNREAEIQRVVAAYEQALREIDGTNG